MIVRVYDETEDRTPGIAVPVTPETTCRDLIECCRDPGEDDCELVGIWDNNFGKYNPTSHPHIQNLINLINFLIIIVF